MGYRDAGVIIMARTLDNMLAWEEQKVVVQAEKKAAEMLLNIHLAELTILLPIFIYGVWLIYIHL